MVTRVKPRVAIIHSASSKNTASGEELAIYLGVCLQLGGFSDVRVVGFSKNSKAEREPKPSGRFSVVPYGKSEPTYPNHAECCRGSWASVSDCNLILVCVDPGDMSACCEALSSAVKRRSDTGIVCFDLGVRNHSKVETHLGNHDAILLAGAFGFSVAKSPIDGHLRCLGAGSLVVERLSKKQAKGGIKFVNLLRSCGIPVIHCKNVSSCAHGAIVFNTVHAVAALAGLPLEELMRSRHARLVWAAMIREGLQVLGLAARGGSWRASNPCCSLTLPQLELFLCLPSPLFAAVSRFVLRFPPGLATTMQADIALGRDTGVTWTVGEIVRLADAHRAGASTCRAILSRVKRYVSTGSGVPLSTSVDMSFISSLPSDDSESVRDLNQKLKVWGSAISLLAAVLSAAVGAWAAVSGVAFVLVAATIKYAMFGDVVP